MKSLWRIPMLLLAVAVAACSSDEVTPPANGSGKLHLATTISGEVSEVIARAQSSLPSELIPSEDQLTLRITGHFTDQTGTTAFDKSWATLADFHLENPDFEAGDYNTSAQQYSNSYTATLAYGNPSEEGAAKAAFVGESAPYTIYAGNSAHNQVPVTVRMANACFTLAVGEWLLNYYTDVELTIHTATNDFTFRPTSTVASELIFVAAGQSLAFSGKAVKAQTGTEVVFPKKTITGQGATAPCTKYAIAVDHGTAGGGSLRISFSDTFTEVPAEEIELNPDEN